MTLGGSDEADGLQHEPEDPQFPTDPDEFDPDSLGPDIPSPPDPSDTEVPRDLLVTFWKLVIAFNVALFALALGAMFVVFRGRMTLGGQIFLVGLFALGYGLLGYYRFERDDDEPRSESDQGDESRSESDDDDDSDDDDEDDQKR